MNSRKKRNEMHDVRMMRLCELCAYTGLGETSARKLAKSAGAERSFGRTRLFDKKLIDRALDKLEEK